MPVIGAVLASCCFGVASWSSPARHYHLDQVPSTAVERIASCGHQRALFTSSRVETNFRCCGVARPGPSRHDLAMVRHVASSVPPKLCWQSTSAHVHLNQ